MPRGTKRSASCESSPDPGGESSPDSEAEPGVDPCVRGRRDPTEAEWDSGRRVQQYLASLGPEAGAKLKLPHNSKLDPTSTSPLEGLHDLGTPEAGLPDGLKNGPELAELDLDFTRHLLLTKHLGKKYLVEGLDTLCYENVRLRCVDLPDDCMALNLASGPGILQCVMQLTPEQKADKKVDKEKVLGGLRDRLLGHIQRVRPAMSLQPSSRPHLMCRSHQTISAAALREALLEEDINFVYLNMWGMKAHLSDYKRLDKASVKAHDKRSEVLAENRDHFFLPNLHDISRDVNTEELGMPFTWSYLTGRGRPGLGTQGQPNCAPMRTWSQMPGVFLQAGGSVQTRGPTVLQWNNITKLTMYVKSDHVLRSSGRFTFSIPKQVGEARRRIEWVQAFLDETVAERLDTFKRIGLGLRIEARVQGLVTTSEAADSCIEQGVHNAMNAWQTLGQWQTGVGEDPDTGNGSSLIPYYPVRFVPPEAVVAHAIRVADVAKQVVKGKSTKPMTKEMRQVLIDLYASLGRTLKGFRATNMETLVRKRKTFWVFAEESLRRKKQAKLPPRRTLPPRGKRGAVQTASAGVGGISKSVAETGPEGRPGRPVVEDSEEGLSSDEDTGKDGSDDDDEEGEEEESDTGVRTRGQATWPESTAIGALLAERRKNRERGGGRGGPADENSFSGDDGSGAEPSGEDPELSGEDAEGGGAHDFDDDAPAYFSGGDDVPDGPELSDAGDGADGDDGAEHHDGEELGGAERISNPVVEGGDGGDAGSGGEGFGDGRASAVLGEPEASGQAVGETPVDQAEGGVGRDARPRRTTLGVPGDPRGTNSQAEPSSRGLGGGHTAVRGSTRRARAPSTVSSDPRRGSRERDRAGRSNPGRGQAFGLRRPDNPAASSFVRVPVQLRRRGADGAQQSESDRREAAIADMRRRIRVRKKSQFGTAGLTWGTTVRTPSGRCGSGSVWQTKEEVFAAIWDKYGEEWANFVYLD